MTKTDKWRTVVDTGINVLVSVKSGEFLDGTKN
jgi:hypothetical protein